MTLHPDDEFAAPGEEACGSRLETPTGLVFLCGLKKDHTRGGHVARSPRLMPVAWWSDEVAEEQALTTRKSPP